MYDDFIFRGESCRDYGAHAFFGDSSQIGASISRNLYELPGGTALEIGEASYKPVTRKVTLVPAEGLEATDDWVRRICGWLGGSRGRMILERDPGRWRLAGFSGAHTLDNRSWPDGCLQAGVTLYGLTTAVRPDVSAAVTSGGALRLIAAVDTDVPVPLRLQLRVTVGTVTAAEIVCGGQVLTLSGFAAGEGTEILYDAGTQGAPELRVGGQLRFDTVTAWRRLKAGRGSSIRIGLTGGEARATASLWGRWLM